MATKKYLTYTGLQEYHEMSETSTDSKVSSAVSTAKGYTDTEINKIKAGTITVANATHADSADSATTANSATKATQDGNGKVISEQYETKTDAITKLNEAKAYTDQAVELKASYIHTHEITQISGLGEQLATTFELALDNENALKNTVPQYRTINGKSLGSDITLYASDVDADEYGSAMNALENAKTYTDEQLNDSITSLQENINSLPLPVNFDTDYGNFSNAVGIYLVDSDFNRINDMPLYIMGNNGINVERDAFGLHIGVKVDESLSSDSVNPVQNKVINIALDNLNNTITSHNISSSAHNDIRDLIAGITTRLNTLANSDDETLDQLSEIVAYIKSNKTLIDEVTTSKVNVSDIVDNLTSTATNKPLSAKQGKALKELIDVLTTVVDEKANTTHGHAIGDVTGLQDALNGKAASSHGTHVTYSTTAPVMDGTASVGTASTVARSDHKHPTDTSRASKTEFDSHDANTTKHITSAERTNWDSAKTHADSAHAPSNAEKNQNAFSNIIVGSTTIASDTATDSLTLVGSNVTLTPDANNDKVTIGITKANVEAALGFTPQTSGSYAAASHTHDDKYYTQTEIDSKLEGKAVSGHGHSDATTSAAGFMTSAMVTKLNGIATGATKVTVDSSLSANSTNPVQNKVINTALTNLTSAVSANTSSVSTHSTAIANLQTAVNEFEEITSSEIQVLFAS